MVCAGVYTGSHVKKRRGGKPCRPHSRSVRLCQSLSLFIQNERKSPLPSSLGATAAAGATTTAAAETTLDRRRPAYHSECRGRGKRRDNKPDRYSGTTVHVCGFRAFFDLIFGLFYCSLHFMLVYNTFGLHKHK